jgi:hypothetical protein
MEQCDHPVSVWAGAHKRVVAHIVLLLALSFLWGQTAAYGQGGAQRQLPPELMPKHPAGKEIARANIDAKRAIENMYSEDALPRSREFKRTDSTYYVGWMFEGIYKYTHAADYIGFKNAAAALEKAVTLLERDYKRAMTTRSDNIMVLLPSYNFQIDFTIISSALVHAYGNTDEPEKIIPLLRRAIKYNMQREFYLDPYNMLAWTVHRNRFYTSKKYSFLKNSIDENERLANKYLDSGMRAIEKNKHLNTNLFPPGYVDAEKNGIYHYKNILHAYNFEIDSANHYFELMRKTGRLPHNNYANFKSICGDFRTAEAEYKIASEQDAADKRLQEWAYFSTILDIYKANPKTATSLARNMIKSAGSTPGYGWYNIALARSLTYDGQVTQAERYGQRAADFKELHIGTTLGQSHYDFSLQMVKLVNKEQAWQMERFEHANWWYNPKVLTSMAGKLSDKYLQQFLIINQFAQNPERERVIYKLFSTENVVSWDEIWYLVRDFSTRYFLNRFRKEAATDKRQYIRKYFEFFTAKLLMEQGKHKEARPILDKLLRDPNTDADYEKLFTARIYQAQAECADALDKNRVRDEWLYKLYVLYPQLVPFTGLKPNMILHISGDADKAVVEKLRGFNINWVTGGKTPAPEAYVIFTGRGKKKSITYYVLDNKGNYLVPQQSFAWQKPEETGKELGYRLFNIGGMEAEENETDTTKKK